MKSNGNGNGGLKLKGGRRIARRTPKKLVLRQHYYTVKRLQDLREATRGIAATLATVQEALRLAILESIQIGTGRDTAPEARL